MQLTDIKGIGPKGEKILNRLNIKSINDLVNFYPFRYDIIKRSDITLLQQDDKITIDGTVENNPNVFYINRKLDKMTFRINVGSKICTVIIFNRGFLKSRLTPGLEVTVSGKYDKNHNTIVANEIRFGRIVKAHIDGVYHTVNGINSMGIASYVKEALNNFEFISYIPKTLEKKYNFLNKKDSIYNIHFPENPKVLKEAIKRQIYEELFIFMLEMNYLKNNKMSSQGLVREVDYNLVLKFIKALPFTLTNDQFLAVEAIYNDLTSNKRMNRLLQGDVGSGKTIVAIIALYINYISGYQGALMAPTEILALQHYDNIKKIFSQYDIEVVLLTGKLKAKEKRQIYDKIETQNCVVIGTHALISDNVKYNNLGLVITDEQHRFGVNQRSNLKNKGLIPDILYMSATPIPRTYALTLYGDMEISSIHSMPNGRKEIITKVYKEQEMKCVLENMYSELKQKHQVYVIAPLIEESDKIDLTNVDILNEKMHKAFGKLYKIGVLHGKMSNDDKDKIMDDFKNNIIQILISTTVIEVGVDVKNATMIVIFDAFRFGLSTLHQLRGRVGRNSLQSYCLLISNKDSKRLEILEETSDGFKISEEDFLLRGSGDLFGFKQSGDMTFGVADLKRDYKILLKCKEDSDKFLNSDDYLSDENKYLRKLIEFSTNLD